MANHLDLEEQEQLDQIKHFWKQYGNLITWALIVVLGSFGGWNFYQYWQRSQAAQASAMFDEVDRMARGGDLAKLDRALADMKDKFARTAYASQAALLAASVYVEAGKNEEAQKALSWVAETSSDEGYKALARLRLAAVLAETKALDEALKQLSGTFPSSFLPLVADRKGDVLMLQGKREEAKAEYSKAYKSFEENSEYRRLVEIKLNALGVDPRPSSVSDAASSAEVKK